MKFLKTAILFFLVSFCNAQNTGNIISKEITPKAGISNIYMYTPPKGLLLPDKIEACIIYQNNQKVYHKLIPLNKVGTYYEFIFQAPDSTVALIISIVNGKNYDFVKNNLLAEKKDIVDNNSDSGFIVYLYDRAGAIFKKATVTAAQLFGGGANYFFNLSEPNTTLLKMYEDGYKLSSDVENENSYLDYLDILYKEKGDNVRNKLLAYATKMELTEKEEQKWINAIRVYNILKMDEQSEKLDKKILLVYPNGEEAKREFWHKFYSVEDSTEQIMISFMNEYITRFKDSSISIKNIFYADIMGSLLYKKQWDKAAKYDTLILDKYIMANLYNSYAWDLSGKELNNAGSDLVFAKALSKKGLDYIKALQLNKVDDNEKSEDLSSTYTTLADTYALILYKLGEYDSAYYYQDAIYKQGSKLDVGGLERYAAYAEKVKGVGYVKQLIEIQLLNGINSPVMVQQLQSIYKELHLPKNEFIRLQQKFNSISRQKTAAYFTKKFGTNKAKNIVLKNILGQTVSLFSFKNKVIVLDFWATWCVPCKAAFPDMQETINEYKNDSNVVFLFIDVWEHNDEAKMQIAISKYIKDNNYSFNVLLDSEDRIVTDYKIKNIPTNLIIDKSGNIVFMGNPANLKFEIEQAKK